jgi:hypothetical protein
MYVHTYIRMYIHTYVCTYIHIHTYMHTYINIHIHIPIHITIHIHIFMYISIYRARMGVGGWATVPSPLRRQCASPSHVTWWAFRGSQCPRHDFFF